MRHRNQQCGQGRTGSSCTRLSNLSRQERACHPATRLGRGSFPLLPCSSNYLRRRPPIPEAIWDPQATTERKPPRRRKTIPSSRHTTKMSSSSSHTPTPVPPTPHDWKDITPEQPEDPRQLGELIMAIGPGTTPPNTPVCSTPDPRAMPVDDRWAMEVIRGEEYDRLRAEMARLDAECEEYTPPEERAARLKAEAEAAAKAAAEKAALEAALAAEKARQEEEMAKYLSHGLIESRPKYPKHPTSRPFLVRPAVPEFDTVLYMGAKLDVQWRGNQLRLIKLSQDEWILKEALTDYPLFTLRKDMTGGPLPWKKEPIVYLYEGSYFASERPNPVGSFRVIGKGEKAKDFVITVMPKSFPKPDQRWWKPEKFRMVVDAPEHNGYSIPLFCTRHRGICDAHWFRVPMGRWTDGVHMEVPMVWRAGKDHCELLRHDSNDYPKLVARWSGGNITAQPHIPFAEVEFMNGVSFNSALGDPFIRFTALTAVKFMGIWDFDSEIQNR
ncbi:hypothetical protein MAPG_09228 [Magnaporthiopsis poae ATCC 64411]|uniref:Uncharacterized protein n=1 Tax=Magnaporthiopsis poae (strain ATCC 64411 / 73-15) TaxID=644358 RepID=A0A0C4E9E5_MAGP6|nr:hypothetical protein MAPG_09228 [Magnaporthiopsis poae ATCC 64411]